jgi:hypothetical protein
VLNKVFPAVLVYHQEYGYYDAELQPGCYYLLRVRHFAYHLIVLAIAAPGRDTTISTASSLLSVLCRHSCQSPYLTDTQTIAITKLDMIDHTMRVVALENSFFISMSSF